MTEFIYSRNAVYETLRANRRQAISLLLAEGAQDKGKLSDILTLAYQRKIKVEKAPRARLDKIHQNHQGVALEVSGYPYSDILDILEYARQKSELPFVLILDSLSYSTQSTVIACAVYFWARLAHAIVYTMGVPVLRTLAFTVGFLAQAALVLAIFGKL